LVIFLMLHSAIAPPPGIRIQLPVVAAPSLPGTLNPALLVAVDRDGQLYFDQQIVGEKELRARLAAKARHAGEPLSLLVRADAAVSFDALSQLTALAAEAGILDVRFETRPPLFPVRRPGGAGP
jgi:biopolymer transport protein ExbD